MDSTASRQKPVHEQLQLFVFTYNRAASLRKLLGYFSKSPFRNCAFTILDNCSTDGTPAVFEEFKTQFGDLRHIRHRKNIGGLANYLRAVEYADTEYSWIITDDDHYDFSQIEDVVAKIESGSVDLISVGIEGHTLPEGFEGAVESFAQRHPFFLGHSLVPALIFRTSLFTPDCLRKGYDNCYTMFPHFPFLASLVRADRTIYVSQRKLITAGVNYGYSTFAYLRGWMQSSASIPDRKVSRIALNNVFAGLRFCHMLVYSIITEKKYRPKKYLRDFDQLFKEALIHSPLNFLKLCAFLPLLLMPAPMHAMVWRIYEDYRRKKGQPLPNFDEDR